MFKAILCGGSILTLYFNRTVVVVFCKLRLFFTFLSGKAERMQCYLVVLMISLLCVALTLNSTALALFRYRSLSYLFLRECVRVTRELAPPRVGYRSHHRVYLNDERKKNGAS